MEKKKCKKRRSVNYFANLGAECHFLKLGCSESSFPKIRGCQCNLPISLIGDFTALMFQR